MRIALVIPPVKDLYFTPQRASFLGVHTIARLLEERGIEHRVFSGVRTRGRPVPVPDEVSYLAEYLGREGFFTGYKRFGITAELLARQVVEYAPDMAFVSCFAYGYAEEAIEVIDALKAQFPGMLVVAGGPGVTAYPDYFLRHSRVDVVAPGSAEQSIGPLILDPYSAPGARFRKSGGDIAANPFAPDDTSFKPVTTLMRESHDTMYYSAMLSRGCPRRCSFCSVRLSFPHYGWARGADILSMIGRIPRTGKRVHVNFEDDNLLEEFERFAEVLAALDLHTGGNFSFSMENGARYALLDPDRIRALMRYRITQLNLPLVTRDERLRIAAGRPAPYADFTAIAAECTRAGIPVVAYLIAGLPGEGAESVREGIEFLNGLRVLVGISPFYPVPGIAGYEDPRAFDGIPPRRCTGMSFFPWHDIGTAAMVGLFRLARRANLGVHD
ncbi:MAG: radical SAM protein [Spirochaetes bacterium]|nr:MAG: radical SAM protein [Spirochaetota bacterium]